MAPSKRISLLYSPACEVQETNLNSHDTFQKFFRKVIAAYESGCMYCTVPIAQSRFFLP